MAYTACVKAHITPTKHRQLRQLAKDAGISVSAYFRNIIVAHAKRLGWVPPAETVGGYVYVIKCGGAYKIGRAANVRQRIAGMALPIKPEIIATVFSAQHIALEKVLHRHFAIKRGHGEWFALTRADVEQVKHLMAYKN